MPAALAAKELPPCGPEDDAAMFFAAPLPPAQDDGGGGADDFVVDNGPPEPALFTSVDLDGAAATVGAAVAAAAPAFAGGLARLLSIELSP